ncbi:TPA: hypothetical protein ACH1O8_002460 [Enterobacter roggenkampii]|uniref:hypothetical protein n=1 Tax=Enterobacter roggenkampii TaxID=1812935 RepID=UPI000807368F|nr:hypothetical protein [Enterobacter roggenkampii]
MKNEDIAMNSRPMSNIDKRALAMTKELATLMAERFSMNPVSSKLLNEAWQKEFPDEVAIAKRMLALLDELEVKDKRLNEILTPNMLLPVIDDMDEDNLRHVIKTVCENYSLLHAKWESEGNRAEAAEKRIAEQREIMCQAASDISYAIFNLTGSDLSRLQAGVVETTDPTDTALIAERNLRAATAGKGEAS